MAMKIIDAQLNDIDAINHLLRASKAYWGYDEQFLNTFMEKLGITHQYLQKNTIKLVYNEDKLIGLYNFIINKDNLLELDNLYLHPDYIGHGLGRKLWTACCNTAKELGKNEFIVWSEPNAENFYLKMGCKKIGVRQSPLAPNRFPPVLRYVIV